MQEELNHLGSEEDADELRSWCRKKDANPPCELAIIYPLLHAAIHFKDLKYLIGSNRKGLGRYISERALPADRIPQLDFEKQHPILNHLPTALGVFSLDFLQKKLGLNQQQQELTVAQQHRLIRC